MLGVDVVHLETVSGPQEFTGTYEMFFENGNGWSTTSRTIQIFVLKSTGYITCDTHKAIDLYDCDTLPF